MRSRRGATSALGSGWCQSRYRPETARSSAAYRSAAIAIYAPCSFRPPGSSWYPPLGTLFLTSNPAAGLDWPVRLLVLEDEKGEVWALYTDFTWIAHRHGIKDRDAAFAM